MSAVHRIGRPPMAPEERRRMMRDRVLVRHARWTPARKAELCMALRGAVVSVSEAVEARGLTREEIAAWLKIFARDGAKGLRVSARRAA